MVARTIAISIFVCFGTLTFLIPAKAADRVQTDRVETDQVETDRIKAARAKTARIKTARIKAALVKAARIKAALAKANDAKTNPVKADDAVAAKDEEHKLPERAVRIAGETGIASIYGFAGDKTAGGPITANGEKFHATDMSAAHKSMPFGTMVRVTNLVNGLSAVVRINNRGPFVKGRIIDLTPAAAEAIGFTHDGAGIAPVTLTVLKD
jgi:rare lipoprotein A